MVDSKSVMEKYNKLVHILGHFTIHKMKMHESVDIVGVVGKLPPSRKDIKHTRKHQKEELSLVQLMSYIRIE